jgi:hypothetical protein
VWSRDCCVIRTPRLNRAAVHYGCRRQSPTLGSQFPLQNLAHLETPGRIDADAESGALFLLTQDAITISSPTRARVLARRVSCAVGSSVGRLRGNQWVP